MSLFVGFLLAFASWWGNGGSKRRRVCSIQAPIPLDGSTVASLVLQTSSAGLGLATTVPCGVGDFAPFCCRCLLRAPVCLLVCLLAPSDCLSSRALLASPLSTCLLHLSACCSPFASCMSSARLAARFSSCRFVLAARPHSALFSLPNPNTGVDPPQMKTPLPPRLTPALANLHHPHKNKPRSSSLLRSSAPPSVRWQRPARLLLRAATSERFRLDRLAGSGSTHLNASSCARVEKNA